MGINSLKLRRLWLPSVLILGAILALSVLVSSLIYPDNIQGNSPVPLHSATATSSPTLLIGATTTTPIQASTSTPVPETTTSLTNCTYTTFFWKSSPERWVIENIVIGDTSFTQAEAVAILAAEPLDERAFLLQQFFAALLNTLKGADSGDAEAALIDAGNWLNAHPEGAEISVTDGQRASELAAILAQYNNGDIGPGHCSDEPLTPTPTPSPSPTPTETPTATPIRTVKTPTDIPRPGGDEDGGEKPTATEPSTTEEPTQEPTKEPTAAPPTNTPRPQPTNTPRPTPTPAPTEPPPTQAPTEPPPTEPPPTQAPTASP